MISTYVHHRLHRAAKLTAIQFEFKTLVTKQSLSESIEAYSLNDECILTLIHSHYETRHHDRVHINVVVVVMLSLPSGQISSNNRMPVCTILSNRNKVSEIRLQMNIVFHLFSSVFVLSVWLD
uniref:Uncharacterized protein n=1 Tax=Glossina brevipalpis TaxID=37001 RepID=A0A1A9WG62_9MUSC